MARSRFPGRECPVLGIIQGAKYLCRLPFSNIAYARVHIHVVEFGGFDGSKFRAKRDQICTTYGPKVNSVSQLDF